MSYKQTIRENRAMLVDLEMPDKSKEIVLSIYDELVEQWDRLFERNKAMDSYFPVEEIVKALKTYEPKPKIIGVTGIKS